jgi:hypothetical protein
MNPILRDHLATTYFEEYQLLRTELVGTLTDDDLDFRPSATAFTLGELCRQIGEIEHSYVDALATFRQDFRWHNPDHEVESSIAALATWFADLDRDLQAAIEALTEVDTARRRIIRDDFDIEEFSPLPPQELDIYREALLIFYGKASVYLRAMGKDLPGHWPHWIG